MLKKFYHIAPKRSGHAFVQRMLQEWVPDITIVDQENKHPLTFRLNVLDGIVILQLRSLENWVASYVEAGTVKGPDAIYRSIDHWMAIANEFYMRTNYLKQYTVVRVKYDEFFCSQDYRKNICRQVGGVYGEKMLNVVKNNGGGSSFSKTEYDGRAQEMNVLNRIDESPMAQYYLINLLKQHSELKKLRNCEG